MIRPLIFETTEAGYVVDERAKWFPQFRDLSQEEMTYVAWITDYNSPFYNQPINMRKQRMADKLRKEKGVDIEMSEAITAAIELYTLIQYDPISEQLQSQRNLHDVYTRELNKQTSMGTSNQDVQKIDRATAIQQRAEKEIERLEIKQRERIVEESKTRGDRVTNFYEVWRKENNVSDIAQQGIANYLTNAV